MELVLATNNANKLAEIQAQLSLTSIKVLSAHDAGVPDDFDVEETGTTFAENAELKARAFSKLTGLPSIADDSGLMVSALGGEPGVHSKRWVPGTDHDRNQYLLQKVQDKSDRSAQFITVLALFFPDTEKILFFEGTVSGSIATEELGSEGFGYDPIFIPEGYDKTFAQLGIETKNTLSHRARAVQKLKTFLEGWQEGSHVDDVSTTQGSS